MPEIPFMRRIIELNHNYFIPKMQFMQRKYAEKATKKQKQQPKILYKI